MREDIKKRIEEVRSGQVPEGYCKVHPYVIPDDWKVVKLGNITKRTSRPNKDGQDRPAYSINNRKGFVPQSEQFEEGSYEDLDKSAYKIVRKGEFAYNPARVNVGSIGRLRDAEEVAVSSLYVCVSVDDKVDGEYFDAWTKSRDFYKETVRNTEGSVREYLFYENFANMRMPIPMFAEQQKIAEILATCDRVIELKQQLLEEKRRQKQWLMQKLLSGEIKVSQYSGEYKTIKVRDLADSLTGFPFDSDAFSEDGIRLMRCGNIGSGKTTWESKATVFWPTTDSKLAAFALQTGDVVIGMDGASVGKSCAMITDVDLPCYLVQRVTRLRSAYPVLLFQWFRSAKFIDYVKSRKTVTAIPHISEQDILEFEICVPQDDVSIRRIECILSNADKAISAMEKEIAEWQQKKKALMQLLLTGLVRVNA